MIIRADAKYYIENGYTTRSYCIQNCIQYPGINHSGKEYEKECIYVCN